MSRSNIKYGGKSSQKKTENNGIEGPTKETPLGLTIPSDICQKVERINGNSSGTRFTPNKNVEKMLYVDNNEVSIEKKKEIRVNLRNESAKQQILHYQTKYKNRCKSRHGSHLDYDKIHGFFSSYKPLNPDEAAPPIECVCHNGKCYSSNSHDRELLKKLDGDNSTKSLLK